MGNDNSCIVSIIIPAYNVEKYIERGIKSCVNQTYSDIEIIIVDDGSTDNTVKVIEKYLNDSRLVLIKQENRGVSAARNVAIKKANGNYIIFLDSDDWLELNTVECLLDFSDEYPNKLICTDRYFATEKDDGKIIKYRQRGAAKVKIVEKHEALSNIGTSLYNLQSSCYKLFESNIIKENKLLFNEEISHGEDGLFVFQYLLHIDGLVFSTEPYWNILDRVGSATSSKYSKKWLSMISAVEIMINSKNLSNGVLNSLYNYMVERLSSLLNYIIVSDETEFIGDYKYVQEYLRNFIKTHKIKRTKKLLSLKTFIYCYFPYKITKLLIGIKRNG